MPNFYPFQLDTPSEEEKTFEKYTSDKYTFERYTFEKHTFEQYTFEIVLGGEIKVLNFCPCQLDLIRAPLNSIAASSNNSFTNESLQTQFWDKTNLGQLKLSHPASDIGVLIILQKCGIKT